MSETRTDRLARLGPGLAALTAILAGLPALRMPLLAEDWPTIAAALRATPPVVLFGYFRPLFTLSFWIEAHVWGAVSGPMHAVSLGIIAACAALVVVLAMRLSCDPILAATAGMLFALQPYHVMCAAWLAARADPLFTLFGLLAALDTIRWAAAGESAAESPHPAAAGRAGIVQAAPWRAMFWVGCALLAKENAAVIPLGLAPLALFAAPRARIRLIARALVPMAVLVALVLSARAIAVSGAGKALLQGDPRDWIARAPGYVAAALLPVDVEILQARPMLYGLIAAGAWGVLLLLARLSSGGIPRLAVGAGIAFVLLLAPALVGFQERYLFFGSVASSLVLAALLRAIGGRGAMAIGLAIVAVWSCLLAAEWRRWSEAATASRALIADLVEASRRPGIDEIIVANLPFRVAGGSVFVYGEFRDALALSGGRDRPVRGAAFVSYRTAGDDALVGPPRVSEAGAEITLQVIPGPFSHYNGPGAVGRPEEIVHSESRVTIAPDGSIGIVIPNDGSGRRAAYVWTHGRLAPLF